MVVAVRVAVAAASACGAVAGAAAAGCAKDYGAAPGPDALLDGVASDEGGATDATTGDGPTAACDLAKIAADPDNCGRCGHSCLGGGCAAGACQPALLATVTATEVFGPVVDSSRVVFATSSQAGSRAQWCPKAGCGAGGPLAVDLPSSLTSRAAIATDGTNAYLGIVGGMGVGVFRLGQDALLTPITPTDGTFQNAEELGVAGTDVFFLN